MKTTLALITFLFYNGFGSNLVRKSELGLKTFVKREFPENIRDFLTKPLELGLSI